MAKQQFRSVNALFFLTLILLLGGCAEPEQVIVTSAAIGLEDPKSLATVYLSPTPDRPQWAAADVPTATPTPPTPTLTPTWTPYIGTFLGGEGGATPFVNTPAFTRPAPTQISGGPASAAECATPVFDAFRAVWEANAPLRQRLRCPTAPGSTQQLVYQPFEHGHMFWRETRDVFVLSPDAFWWLIDSWTEGQPENDPSLNPPEGRLQPVRGFGAIWRSNPAIRDGLGWAISEERAYDVAWQNFEGGWMLSIPGYGIFAMSPEQRQPPTTGVHFGALG